ncbi:Bol1 protein [Saccharomycopsis crataegensis]|uniref:Bol1 protein n=1 Tax=Saccharomycopsis crataegensis TaxID=43959 RepID=A0AAV5QLW5_9ASCO|nr:Bol1 protein [Saccharomycopsis crataegensis]
MFAPKLLLKSPRLASFLKISKATMSTSSILSAKGITFSSETPGPIEISIAEKISEKLNPESLVIFNDSHKHAGHHGLRGASNTTESHFRLEVISGAFAPYKTQPNRHRLIYNILDDELKTKGVHALQLKTKTPEEIAKLQKTLG